MHRSVFVTYGELNVSTDWWLGGGISLQRAAPTMPRVVYSKVLIWNFVKLVCIQTVWGAKVSVRFETVTDTSLLFSQTLTQSTSETHCLDTCVRNDFCSSVSFNKNTLECRLSVVTHNLMGVLTQGQTPSFNTYFKTGMLCTH